MTTVPFLDLKGQYQAIKTEILEAIEKVLSSTQFVLGPEVLAFEKEFAQYVNASHGVGTSSGTSALQMAFVSAGIGAGDEVITIPHTFVATVAAIGYTGATPVFVDIEPESFTMDSARLEAALTSKTKAIAPVHLYGQSADMDPILEFARKHNLVVVEDAAQAHGAEYKGRRCGSMGDMATFSFYPGKNLGAYGEGGLVTTSNDEYNRLLRMYRDWGAEKKYMHELKGFNARLEGIQGAVLRVKLRHLEKWTESRRRIARRYGELMAGIDGVVLPKEVPDRRHVWHIYAVRVKDREGFMKFLGDRGVSTGIHYPVAVHELGAWKDLGYKRGDFPVSEAAADEVVSLPMFPEMTDPMIEQVAEAVHAWGKR